MWIGDTIYFEADPDGVLNLYSLDPRSGQQKQLTRYTDYDAGRPSDGNGKIVFDRANGLEVYDTATGRTKRGRLRDPPGLAGNPPLREERQGPDHPHRAFPGRHPRGRGGPGRRLHRPSRERRDPQPVARPRLPRQGRGLVPRRQVDRVLLRPRRRVRDLARRPAREGQAGPADDAQGRLPLRAALVSGLQEARLHRPDAGPLLRRRGHQADHQGGQGRVRGHGPGDRREADLRPRVVARRPVPRVHQDGRRPRQPDLDLLPRHERGEARDRGSPRRLRAGVLRGRAAPLLRQQPPLRPDLQRHGLRAGLQEGRRALRPDPARGRPGAPPPEDRRRAPEAQVEGEGGIEAEKSHGDEGRRRPRRRPSWTSSGSRDASSPCRCPAATTASSAWAEASCSSWTPTKGTSTGSTSASPGPASSWPSTSRSGRPAPSSRPWTTTRSPPTGRFSSGARGAISGWWTPARKSPSRSRSTSRTSP